MTTPTVSACMIVRDEPLDQLKAAIASIRPLVDELVVVDTGSAKVPDLAGLGVDVHDVFTDCNDEDGQMVDFALARNHSRSLAHGEYFTWIDADDVVVGPDGKPPAPETLRALL